MVQSSNIRRTRHPPYRTVFCVKITGASAPAPIPPATTCPTAPAPAADAAGAPGCGRWRGAGFPRGAGAEKPCHDVAPKKDRYKTHTIMGCK